MTPEALRSALADHEPEVTLLPNGENRFACSFEGDQLEALTELAQQHLFHGSGLDRVRRVEAGVEILGRREFGTRFRVALSRSGDRTRLSVHQVHESSAGLWAALTLGTLAGGALFVVAPPFALLGAGLLLALGWRSDRSQFRRRVKALLLDLRVGLYERQHSSPSPTAGP